MMPSRPFKTAYRAYSVSMLPGNERTDVERGGKSIKLNIFFICKLQIIKSNIFLVIMPPSALEQLSRQRIVYPMLFKLSCESTGRTTHCGVLEFVADEGKVYLPNWVSLRKLAII
jgi:ubiquitin fusion degradation protein 1